MLSTEEREAKAEEGQNKQTTVIIRFFLRSFIITSDDIMDDEEDANTMRRTKGNTNTTNATTAKEKAKSRSRRGAPPRRPPPKTREDGRDASTVYSTFDGRNNNRTKTPPPLKTQKEGKTMRQSDDDDDDDDDDDVFIVDDEKKGEKKKLVPPRPKPPNARAKKTARPRWWKDLPEEKCDPITLEPFCEQAHAPFELLGKKFKREQSYSSLNDEEEVEKNAAATTSEEQRVKHLFDPEALAEYVVNAKTFENPLTREALDPSDCQRLDEHLRKFSLKKFNVHRAYVNLQKEKKDELENAGRRTEEQRARMQREREELRRTLAASMFTSIRERRQGDNNTSRNHRHQNHHNQQRHSNNNDNGSNVNDNNGSNETEQVLAANLETSIEQQENAFRAFGAFAMVDDDIAMSRGQTLRAAHTSFSGWSNPEAIRRQGNNGNISLSSAENFPSLGSGSTTTRIGTGGWSQMAQRASSLHDDGVVRRPRVQPPRTTSSTEQINHHEQQRAHQREAEFAAAALPNDSVNADEARRAQLAAAFGISNPDSHVSAFAVSGAKSAFKQEHLKAAKNNPRLCAQIEQKFEEMARDANNRRATFPPMTKFLRGVVHEYAALWGFTSQSYGNEPNRRVDVFRTTACKKPSINLREAILAHDELKKEKEEKDRMMTSNGAGAGGISSSINQPPEEASEDEYFPGFTAYHTKQTGGIEYERLTATFSDGAEKKTVFLMLRPWAGQFAVEVDSETDLDDIYIAHFKNPEALKKASGVIGGGVKGKFKVKYSEIMAKSSSAALRPIPFGGGVTGEGEDKSGAANTAGITHSPPKIFELRRKKKP